MVGWLKWPKAGKSLEHADKQQVAPMPPLRVYVSADARKKLIELLEANDIGQTAAVRIVVSGQETEPLFGLEIESSGTPGVTDFVIPRDRFGFSILVAGVDVERISGATIQFVDDPLRPGFRIEPPGPVMLPMVSPAAPPHSH